MTTLLKLFKILFTRAAFLYVLIYLLCSWLINSDVVKTGTVVRILNDLMPSAYQSLTAYEKPIPAKELESYIQYYAKVSSYFPQMPDAFGLLGYCYFRKGDQENALLSLRQAAALNRHFFWFHYNLGVLFYKTGQYELAVQAIKKSIETKPEMALIFLKTSRLYQHILLSQGKSNAEITQSLNDGYQKSFELLISSYDHLKDYKSMYQIASYAQTRNMENSGTFAFWAGLAQFRLKDYPTAAYFFNESIKKDPHDPQAFTYLALSLKNFGQEKLAETALLQAALLNKKYPSRDRTELTYGMQIY